MSNKELREKNEIMNLFKDPKFSRQAWRSIGIAILQNPASKPHLIDHDKNGDPTIAEQIENYSYQELTRDIKTLGEEDRPPTELEMIMKCQIMKARFDTNAAIFIRDTLGAKPVDESKIDAQVNNPYESLTDEELDMLIKHREQKALESSNEAKGSKSTN